MRLTGLAALVAAGVALAAAGCGGGGDSTTTPVQAGEVHCDLGQGDGWCWQNTRVTGHAVKAASFVDADHGWAVGTAGTVLRSVDGGAHWIALAPGVSTTLTAVVFVDRQAGWVLAADGTVLRTIDGGDHWQATRVVQVAGGWTVDTDLQAPDAQTVLVKFGDETWVSHDGGVSFQDVGAGIAAYSEGSGDCWQLVSGRLVRLPACDPAAAVAVATPGEAGRISSFSSEDGVHGLATVPDAAGGPAALATSDGGQHWTTRLMTAGSWRVEHVDGAVGWARNASAGGPQAWLRTRDGGASWTAVTAPQGLSEAANASAGTLDANTLWFGAGNRVVASADGGVSWIDGVVPDESATSSATVLSASAEGRVLVRFGERFYATTDRGATWTRLLGPDGRAADAGVAGMHFWDAANGYELFTDGSAQRTTDGGRTWAREAGVGMDDAVLDALTGDLRFVSGTHGWTIVGGVVHATGDRGRTWRVVTWSSDADAIAEAMDFIDENNGWIVAMGGAVHRTTDGGAHWSQVGNTVAKVYLSGLRELRFRDNRNGLFVTTLGSIERTTDGGATWHETNMFDSGPMSARLRWTGAGTAWMVNGGVYRSTDAGATWTDLSDRLPGADVDSPWLSDIVFVDAAHGWIVGRSGQVYATNDGGNSWVRQAAGIDANLVMASFVDANTGWIATDDGRFLATASAGR